MPRITSCRSLFAIFLCITIEGLQAAPQDGDSPISAELLSGLRLRGIGPAVMGGRISDIAIHPTDRSIWYVAAGSGGVWKTVNAGTTWKPIFDQQPSYSIGCLILDPSNPEIVWVGTGENVSGRHVGWGDGVYRSRDGGASWQRMGLEDSQHIGKIVVDPRDGNVVLVAAEGPLWSAGGQRGLFKTTDGGQTWKQVLAIDENTGVTDVEFDPRNPDVLYAASYQRRRTVWALLAGGPGSGIHKSTDNGESWRRLENGLPQGELGKIALAVSPADPDVVYATIEAAAEQKGFYRSRDRGGSWERRNSYISNGTGPHYYQEIEASPHDVDVVYQMDVFFHVTRDGGASFNILGTGREKHSDNHALVIDPEDTRHLIAGTDGGLYESFDDGVTWRHFPNLPLAQFYKMALDNSEPFYNVLGGAQDLGTLLGPSRTLNVEGISNRDWTVPLGADGYACAFDPQDPDTLYLQWQVGRLHRYDRRSEEALDIQPQPAPGDPPERWNWDAPVIVSPHSAKRLYFGSQRLWRSDDRGDSWTPISGDLTRNQNRYQLEMASRVRSVDALYDNGAMSLYSTLTTISESPLVEGLLYVGGDDGLIQVSEDGGGSWRAVDNLPGLPTLSFVNDLQASHHDPDTVFVIIDAHKTGDFRPHVFESRDRGRSWKSIAGDLPPGGILWAIEQDHINRDLLFVGAEFGLYFTVDRGQRWVELSGGVPAIAFRDLKLHRRDNDLVGASFGRGFYVLDDYSVLREVAGSALEDEARLFAVRDAWWYVPSVPMQAPGKPSQGSTDFSAENPPFGALLTYYLRDTINTTAQQRRRNEEKLRDEGQDIPFPGWQGLLEEDLEREPKILLTVRDAQGQAIRRLTGPARKGIHRVSWDLRLSPPDPIRLETPAFRPPWAGEPLGPLAPPGRYRVEMALLTSAGLQTLSQPREFQVKPVEAGSSDVSLEVAAFQQATGELLRQVAGASEELDRSSRRLRFFRQALLSTAGADPALFTRLGEIEAVAAALRTRLTGDRIRRRKNEATVPSISERVSQVAQGHWETRQPPTATQRQDLEWAQTAFDTLRQEVKRLVEVDIPGLEAELEAAGAPWTPGRELPR